MSLAGLTGARRMPTRDARPDLGDRVDDLEREARAVLDRAAIGIRALVGAVAQELVDQVAVGAVDFDAVEAGALGVVGGVRIVGDDLPRSRPSAARAARRLRRSRLSMKVLVLARIAEGATGAPPFGCSEECETRPTCQSWTKMRPPASCTAVGHLAPALDLRLAVEPGVQM